MNERDILLQILGGIKGIEIAFNRFGYQGDVDDLFDAGYKRALDDINSIISKYIVTDEEEA